MAPRYADRVSASAADRPRIRSLKAAVNASSSRLEPVSSSVLPNSRAFVMVAISPETRLIGSLRSRARVKLPIPPRMKPPKANSPTATNASPPPPRGGAGAPAPPVRRRRAGAGENPPVVPHARQDIGRRLRRQLRRFTHHRRAQLFVGRAAEAAFGEIRVERGLQRRVFGQRRHR